MNRPEYLKQYGIEPFISPQFMQHTEKKDKENEIVEYEQMVHSTSSLPNEKMQDVYMINWMMMVFHVFGITEMISKYYIKSTSISYTKFYECLMEYITTHNSLFGREFSIARKHCEGGYSGKGWDYYDTTLGSISWPMEEASWLRLVKNENEKAEILDEIKEYFTKGSKKFLDKQFK